MRNLISKRFEEQWDIICCKGKRQEHEKKNQYIITDTPGIFIFNRNFNTNINLNILSVWLISSFSYSKIKFNQKEKVEDKEKPSDVR